MIITATPYRISFFGGGTDYPAWFNQHGGAVLAAGINRYCYINCRYLPPFFEHRHRIVWSQIELVNEAREVSHPAVRAAIEYLSITEGLEIHHNGDLPARSGMGSSSAFVVGLLHALYTLKGQIVSKMHLAQQAIYVEQELLKEHVGVQDQITVAFGGLNVVEIKKNGSFDVNPVPITEQRVHLLQDHLLLFFTGISRYASEIAKAKIEAIPNKQDVLLKMQSYVPIATDILISGRNLNEFGELLHENWLLKRSISGSVSNEIVDEIYARARKVGAIGGKLLGAGGGGFILFFAAPQQHARIREELAELFHVPFQFESSGTRLLFYDRMPGL